MKPSRVSASATLRLVSASVLSLLLSAPPTVAIAAVANPDGAAPVSAPPQDAAGFGPLNPAPPANMTPQQIIDKFAARETLFSLARQNYTFRQTVRVDTLAEDTNRVDGEYQQVTDITFDKDGKRAEHVVFAPRTPSTASR
ncbi:hypothetical protein RBB78_07805 [Tunturiibacter empetritectus]|uniref:hypothetical protein n=1 Tax=Tunturiibacter empetritectus TaxID=3069691 RepID=UPI003D9B15F1